MRTKMKNIVICILALLIGIGLHGQSYKVDLFDIKNEVKFDIWTYGAWQPTDSTHLTASISKLDTVYIFRLNSIESNQIILWSVNEIKKSAFPFFITERNEIKIVESDKYEQMLIALRNDVKKRMELTDKDMEDMEGYQNFLFSPRVMYEAYHQPYIEILKHFISEEIRNQTIKTFEPNFSDSIPANFYTSVKLENSELKYHYRSSQDSIEVCNYLADFQLSKDIEERPDTTWYSKLFNKPFAHRYDRINCPYMHTEYQSNSTLFKNGKKYKPKRIEYTRKEPTSVRIVINAIE